MSFDKIFNNKKHTYIGLLRQNKTEFLILNFNFKTYMKHHFLAYNRNNLAMSRNIIPVIPDIKYRLEINC